MKYISQYFPFIILTLFLYGLLFHFHNQSTLIPPLPVNSGQQAMQLQFTEVAEPLADQQQSQADEQQREPNRVPTPTAEPTPQPSSAPVTAAQPPIPENASKVEQQPQRQQPPAAKRVEQASTAQPVTSNAEQSQPVTPTAIPPVTAQPIAAQQLPSKPVDTPIASNETPATAQTVDSETSNEAPATQQSVETQTNNKAPTTAQPVATQTNNEAPTTAQPVETQTNNEAPTIPQAQPVETQSSSEALAIAKQKLHQSIENTKASEDARLKAELFAAEFNLVSASVDTDPTPIEIVKAAKRPLAAEKPNDKPQPAAIKKAVVVKPDNSKMVFKKQPSATSNTQNQGVLQEAIVVSGNTPIYPQRAILRNQQGRVVVKLTVTMKGQAKNPEIITSSGYEILDNAILDFIQKELFMPAHKGEEKVTSEQIFAFRFELK